MAFAAAGKRVSATGASTKMRPMMRAAMLCSRVTARSRHYHMMPARSELPVTSALNRHVDD